VSRRAADRRIRYLGVVLTLAFGLALTRAAWIQGVQSAALEQRADAQQRLPIVIPASRGSILDRNGVELARGEAAVTVYADPRSVTSPLREAAKAARVLGLDSAERAELARSLRDHSSGFVYVERKAPADKARRLERMKLAGFGFYGEEKRVYPQGSLAAQLLGFAGVDNRGLAGLELTYDRSLRGRSGHKTVLKDPNGKVIEVLSSTDEQPGADVTLSLDNVIQLDVERVLRHTLIDWQAKAATATVLDPRTGEVLAMATAPGYDANSYAAVSAQFQRNRAVTDSYEPGSTFKLVTVSGVLSDGLVSPSTAFTLPYEITVADKQIHDAHPRGTERLTVAEILAQSSNVGAVTLSQKLGKSRLAHWIASFGFGRPTGIDFPGESSATVPPLDKWYGSTEGTIPIGQGITVTPIQLAAAYAAIANGGVWIQPHLALTIGGKPAPAPRSRRIVSRAVARQLMVMLRGVVDEGTGTAAEIEGYTVAGKTGTAAKVDAASGGYSSSRYVASFVGIVPASKPRLVILVTVDEPALAIWGGVVAAPAVKEIALDCLRYLEVPPDQPGSAGQE
jgi:cell division protein FtsI (penicillin-binding protein 3)